MIEPEVSFADLDDLMDLEEEMIKFIINHLFATCPDELNFLNSFVDKTLIDKLRDGDAVSWDEFYDRYHDIIFDVGKYRGLSDDECNDLVQEVMLRFFQKAKTFTFDPGIAKFRTYFSKIVSGKIVDILRKRLKTVSDISSELDNNMGVQESPDVELDRCILFQWRRR